MILYTVCICNIINNLAISKEVDIKPPTIWMRCHEKAGVKQRGIWPVNAYGTISPNLCVGRVEFGGFRDNITVNIL